MTTQDQGGGIVRDAGRSHAGRWRRLFGPSVSAEALGLLAGWLGVASVVAILATVVRLLAWRMDLHYVEPWYDGEPPDKHYLDYASFIDRQLLWTGLPLIVTNLLTLGLLWISLRRQNRST